MAALDVMSAHRCDNAFFDIKFGHNPFGTTYARHSIRHDALIRKSGIVRRVCQTFVDSMSTDVRVRVDNFMETLFRSQRTTLSNSCSEQPLHQLPWWCNNTSHDAQLPPLARHDVGFPLVVAYS
jgi:hypothetical protein